MKYFITLFLTLAIIITASAQSITWVDGGSFAYPDNDERLRLKNNTSIAWFNNPGSDSEVDGLARVGDLFGILNLTGTQGINMTRNGLSSDIVITSTGNIGIGGASSSSDITMNANETTFRSGEFELDLVVDLQGAGGIGLFTEENLFIIDVNEQNGTLRINSELEVNVPTTPSDIRLKKEVNELTDALSLVENLRPVSYYVKDKDVRRHLGLIAQEVEQTLPSIVSELSQKHPDGTALKGIKYQELIPVLIKAIQEQQEVIYQQGVSIKTLEAKIK